MDVTLEVDGSGPQTVPLPTLERLPTDGVVLSRTIHPDSTPTGAPASVSYLHRTSLVRFALAFARTWPQAAPIVIWPHDVPARRTAVALATGRLLASHRPVGPVPAVVCAVRPPMRRTRPAVRHHVHATTHGRTVDLVVWELMLPGAATEVHRTAVPLELTA
jgi:hypothetical protein